MVEWSLAKEKEEEVIHCSVPFYIRKHKQRTHKQQFNKHLRLIVYFEFFFCLDHVKHSAAQLFYVYKQPSIESIHSVRVEHCALVAPLQRN